MTSFERSILYTSASNAFMAIVFNVSKPTSDVGWFAVPALIVATLLLIAGCFWGVRCFLEDWW